jgi:hypothetical protein
LRQRNQLVGGLAHGGNDDRDLITCRLRGCDPSRDVLYLLGVTN